MRDFFRNFRMVFLFGGLVHFSGVMADTQPAIRFIENKNQWTDDVHYAARIPGGTMLIGPGSFKYFFLDGKKLEALHYQCHQPGEPDALAGMDHRVRGHAVHVKFLGANVETVPRGIGKSSEYYNYFIGHDPRHWASGAFAYEGMLYESFYRDIDLKIYAARENVKYDFIVAPGADPSQISISYQGADKIFLDNGNLLIRTSLADIIEQRPFAYQYIGGKKVTVKCEYRLDDTLLSFIFPEGFDPCYALTIDPLLIFSTFSGSTADNWGSTATPGEHGNL